MVFIEAGNLHDDLSMLRGSHFRENWQGQHRRLVRKGIGEFVCPMIEVPIRGQEGKGNRIVHRRLYPCRGASQRDRDTDVGELSDTRAGREGQSDSSPTSVSLSR